MKLRSLRSTVREQHPSTHLNMHPVQALDRFECGWKQVREGRPVAATSAIEYMACSWKLQALVWPEAPVTAVLAMVRGRVEERVSAKRVVTIDDPHRILSINMGPVRLFESEGTLGT